MYVVLITEGKRCPIILKLDPENDIKSNVNQEFVVLVVLNGEKLTPQSHECRIGQETSRSNVRLLPRLDFPPCRSIFLMQKYLQTGLFDNPGRIFLNVFVLWAQDGHATRLLANPQVPADGRAHVMGARSSRGRARHGGAHITGTCTHVLPFCCLHQVFVINGKEFFSVLLLHLVCDSTQETAHSCNKQTNKQTR